MSGRQHWTAKSCCSCNVHLRSETWVILIVSLVKMSFIQQNVVGILVGLMPALWVFPSGSEGCFLWRQIFEWARNRVKSSFISEGFSVELPIILLVGSGGSEIWLGSLPGTSWVRYSGHVLPRGDHGLKRPLGWMDGWISPFITNALPQWRCLGSYVHSTYFLTWFTANKT